MAKSEQDDKERARLARQLSLGMTIPALMGGGALVGCGLGWLAVHFLHWGEWAFAVGILVGMAAGIWQVVHVIKDMNR